MAEEEKKVAEGEDLNWDKDSYTKEEVEAIKKELSWNHEKWVQKLISEKKAFDEVFQHLGEVSDNPEALIALYEDKPDVAKIILDKYYDGKDIETFKKESNYKPDLTDPDVLDRLLEKKAQEKVEANLISDKKEAFMKKLKLSEEEIADFNEAFEDRRALKSFKLDNLEKVFERTYRDIDADAEALKDYKKTMAEAGVMASGKSNAQWGTSKPKSSLDKQREGVSALLNKYKRKD